jgi:hypothetical protein
VASGDPALTLFASPHLRFQLARIAAELTSAVRIGEAFADLLDQERPSLCVLGQDAFTVERVLVRVARSRSIPTVALIHGGFRPRRIYRNVAGETDRLLVWGPEDVAGLIGAGVEPGRVGVVGSVVYQERYPVSPAPPDEGAVQRARERLGLPPKRPVVLVLTAAITSGLAAIARPATHRQCWRELTALAAGRPEVTVAIKPHPSYDHFELYRRIADSGPPNLVLLEDVQLAIALTAATAAIMINYSTTAGMECAMSGVPVVLWLAGLFPANADDPMARGGARVVGSAAELAVTLDRLLVDPGDRAEALTAAAAATAQVLGDPKPAPIDRVVAELHAAALPEGPAAAIPAPPPADGRRLEAACYVIGKSARDPTALRAGLAAVLEPARAAQAVSASVIARSEAVAYLAALARRVTAGDERSAAALAKRLLAVAPRLVLAWPTVRRTVLRLAAGAACGRALGALAGRTRTLLGRWRGGLWRPAAIHKARGVR